MRRLITLFVVGAVGLSAAPVTGQATGSAIVTVEVLDGRDGRFRFVGTPAGELTLGLGLPRSLTAADLVPGSHTATLEAIDPTLEQSGYALVDVLCDDRQSAQPSLGDVEQKSAVFQIEAGETVTCRFMLSPPPGSDQKVVLLGLTDDREQWSQEFHQSLADACTMARTIQTAAEMAVPQMSEGIAAVRAATAQIMQRVDAPNYTEDDALAALDRGVEEICNPDGPDVFVGPFTITYASCMMRMDAQGSILAIRLPPNAAEATMEISSLADDTAIVIALNRDLSATASVTGPGESTGLTMSATGAERDILGLRTLQYNFEYAASFSGAGGALEGILGSLGNPAINQQDIEMKITNTGTAWIAPDAPGADIVSTFYNNFASGIEAGQGIGSFYSGIIRSLAGMVQNGIPLEIDQTIKAPMGMSSQSSSVIVGGPYLLPLEPGLCGTSTIPAGFAVQKLSTDESECDCSCEGFQRFSAENEQKKKARKKMSKKERKAAEQNDPAAMCMVSCGTKWMRCAMRGQ